MLPDFSELPVTHRLLLDLTIHERLYTNQTLRSLVLHFPVLRLVELATQSYKGVHLGY